MEINSIIEVVLGAVIAVMGYFLKVVHSDVRQNTKEVGENKGKLENAFTMIEHERELRSQSYTTLLDTLNEIKNDIKELKK